MTSLKSNTILLFSLLPNNKIKHIMCTELCVCVFLFLEEAWYRFFPAVSDMGTTQ